MQVKLGELTRIRTGKLDANASSTDGKYPFFTCSKEPLRIDSYSYDCECVLVAGNGDLNVKYYNGKFDAYQRTYIIEENGEGKLFMPYLYYFLEGYVDELRKLSIGGVIKYIKLGNLTDALIELPDIQKQKAIVDILAKAKGIINIRKQEIQSLDDLIKARFVEMFNTTGMWQERPLSVVCKQVKRYPTFCNMEYIEDGVRVIRIGNILEDGHMDEINDNYVFVYADANKDYPDTVIEKNDIVMAVRGDGSTAKRIGIITEDILIGANISPNLIRIQANEEMVLPRFLFCFLTSEIGQQRLEKYVNKTAKKNIAAKDIVKVMLPVPPLDVQEQFSNFIAQVDKSKLILQKSLHETQMLFDKLMQQYFD